MLGEQATAMVAQTDSLQCHVHLHSNKEYSTQKFIYILISTVLQKFCKVILAS
jgi:hypothetical protein